MNKKTIAILLFLTVIAILAVITLIRFAENLGESYRTFGFTITGSSQPDTQKDAARSTSNGLRLSLGCLYPVRQVSMALPPSPAVHVRLLTP